MTETQRHFIGISLRGVVLTALIGAAGTVLSFTILGAAHSVRSAWYAKADTASVNAAIRGLADSLHVIHVEGDSTAFRVRQMWCKDKVAEGCR